MLQVPVYFQLGYAELRWDAYQNQGEDILENNTDPDRFENARLVFEEQLTFTEEQGWEDARLGMAHYNVGAMAWSQFRYNMAREHFEKALEIFERTNGPKGYYCSVVRSRLGEIDMSVGRYPDAEQRLSSACAGIREFLGPDNPLYLRTRAKLGLLYFFTGRQSQAKEALWEVYPRVKDNEKIGDPAFLRQLDNAAAALRYVP